MGLGRNDFCPCGSGKKSKKCCGSSVNVSAAQRVRAIQSKSENGKAAQSFFRMGNACVSQGKMQLAIVHYENALSLDGNYFECCSNLANVLAAIGKQGRAIDCFEHALSIKQDAKTHFDLANVYEATGEIDQAITHFEHALTINPEHAEAHNNLGNLIKRSRGLLMATHHYRQAIAYRPKLYEAHNNLALALLEQGEATEAVVQFRHALSLNSNLASAHDNLLYALNYLTVFDPEAIYAEHLKYGQQIEASMTPSIPVQLNSAVLNTRLRIGYVSADLRQHSVAHFIEPVLANHDRSRFEIFCYSNHVAEDVVAERLKLLSEHWLNIGRMSDSDVVKQIKLDQIDILVDLGGHTQNNRLTVFASKPSPVQVTWLGYPNTTGLSRMDYRITDRYADPIGITECFHSETLVRLPEYFSCYKPPNCAPSISTLPAQKNGYVTFGSFNKLAKINQDVIAVWAKLLIAVPDSRLFLKTSALVEAGMRNKIRSIFESMGVSSERLELKGTDQSQKSHLEQYSAIDIGLDPFPYNGTTTTCEALWMGVPVITMAGLTHVSRVGLSQMTNLGLTELICTNQEDYIATAVRLSSDLRHLDALRNDLRQRMAASPLMNAGRFTKHLEEVFVAIRHPVCA